MFKRLITHLLSVCLLTAGTAQDAEEQAYVYVKSIAWCKKPECLNGKDWRIHRSPDCEYETRQSVIRAICNITVDKNWRTADNWTMKVWGPKPDYGNDPSADYHFFYLQKHTFNGIPQYSINWNANKEGEPVHDSAQWNLGEDYSYFKDPDKDIHTIKGHGTEIVLNFELSLHKYPEPESTVGEDLFEAAYCTAGMVENAVKIILLYDARINQLMQLKLEQIKDNPNATPEYIEKLTKAALDTQKAWEAFATARSRESSAGYGNGSGAGLGFNWTYEYLQKERIKELLSVYK